MVRARATSTSGIVLARRPAPFGAFSAGPSRSASASSGSSDPPSPSMPAHGSPVSAKRAGTVASVWSSGRTAGTSSQRSGVDTRASGVARTEYAEATVRSLAFWLKSTNTPCRSSFHQRLVASAGARASTSRATVSAARRTCG